MKLLLSPNIWQLETAVCCLVMVLTAVYVLVGVCGVGWCVLCITDGSGVVVEVTDKYKVTQGWASSQSIL